MYKNLMNLKSRILTAETVRKHWFFIAFVRIRRDQKSTCEFAKHRFLLLETTILGPESNVDRACMSISSAAKVSEIIEDLYQSLKFDDL